MSRPSRNTDTRLLKAGRDLLPQTGVSGLNVRQIAKKARVNLGMFHYYFKTKDVFARRVLQEHYEEMFSELHSEAQSGASPLENLRAVLMVFGRMARDKRKLLIALLRDVGLGEPATLDFLRVNLHRHVELILRLIAQAQAAGQIGPVAPLNAFALLMTAVNLPSIIGELAIRHGGKHGVGSVAALVEQQVLTDAAIAERLDVALAGLAVYRPAASQPQSDFADAQSAD